MTFVVTLVRHGETDFNVKHLIHTSSNDTINDKGRAQADALGKYLTNEKYTKIFSSDLQRCQDTAQGVLNNLKHPTPAIVLDKRLRERDFAEWDGRPMTDIFKMAKEQNVSLRSVTAPGGESYDEAAKRVVSFFQEIFELRDKTEEDENILIFSHGLTIQSFIQYLNIKPEIYELENCPFEPMKFSGNTARTQFSIGKVENERRKVKFNCLHDESHL